METERAVPWVGVAASLATLAALAAPYVLVSDSSTGLGVYYSAGLFGAGGAAFLALIAVVGFLAGERGNASREVAAGVALVVAVGTFGLATAWALAVPAESVFGFPAAWMGWHRWAVVALAGVGAVAAAAYARSAVGR